MSTADAFNPWTATRDEAIAARRADPTASPDPFAQFTAAQEVLAARSACEGPGSSLAIMQCIAVCGINSLVQPEWLVAAFLPRQARVARADVGSWDEAFGRPYRGGSKTLVREQKRRREMEAVYAEVWRLVLAEGDLPVNKALFAQIAATLPSIGSASTVERRYQDALADGRIRPSELRDEFERANPHRLTQMLRTGAATENACSGNIPPSQLRA